MTDKELQKHKEYQKKYRKIYREKKKQEFQIVKRNKVILTKMQS